MPSVDFGDQKGQNEEEQVPDKKQEKKRWHCSVKSTLAASWSNEEELHTIIFSLWTEGLRTTTRKPQDEQVVAQIESMGSDSQFFCDGGVATTTLRCTCNKMLAQQGKS